MHNFIDKISKSQNEAVNTELAKLLYGCNLPFRVVQSVHFKSFCKAIRPSYRPPNEKQIAGKYLDCIFESLCTKTFREQSVLLIDGWTNDFANTKNVTAMLHCADGSCLFLESFDFTEDRETSERLCEIVQQCKKKAWDIHRTEIFAVVTDNASNMRKMGRNVPIWNLTCNSHTGELLAKDLVDKSLVKKVKFIY